MFLTNISLKRPVFALVVVIALVVIGITGFLSLPINDMPELDVAYISVVANLPGASPEQVENKVTKKMEEALGQISGVKHITSTVTEGTSATVIEFQMDKPSDLAVQDVRTKVSGIRGSLPQEMEEPIIAKFDINALPIISLVITGKLNTRDMSRLIDDTIIPRLNAVNGVGSITANGVQQREIQINLDKEKLDAFNLTCSEVLNSLKSDNLNNSTGKLSDGYREINLKTYDSIKNVNDFNNILLALRDGTEIRVRDVARVTDSFKEQSSLSYYDGKECIALDIVKQSNANTVQVAENVRQEMRKLQASLPSGVKIAVVNDNSTHIKNSVKNIETTMIEGCLLAVLIVFLFLRGLESTAVSAISLPASIITTFAALKFMNFSLNNMSLLALSLAVGLLIDDSIVVIENIVRHMRMGKPPWRAAQEATGEISLAVMATTFTVVATFVPIATMNGLLGKFFKEFGLTVAISVLVSLFISFTLVPLLASRYVKSDDRKFKGPLGWFLAWFNHMFDLLGIYYLRLLEQVLNHRKKTLAITAALFILSLALVPQMGINFQPKQDQGKISVSAALDSGLSLIAADKTAHKMQEIARQYPDVRHIYTTVKPGSINLAIQLSDKKERKATAEQIALRMRDDLRKLPGLDLSVQPAEGNAYMVKSYALHVRGDDFKQLLDYSQKARRILNQIPGVEDASLSYKSGKPEVSIDVDRDLAADLGVNPATVSATLNTLFNGVVVGQYEAGNDRCDVRARLGSEQRQGLASLDGIYVPSSKTNKDGPIMIPLEQLSKTVFTTSASTINRYEKMREIQLQANFVGLSSLELDSAFMNKLNQELPPSRGIKLAPGGDTEFIQESAGSLLQAVILGILFIFLILAAQFESFIDPLAIMFSLPLAIIGALAALWVTGAGLSMIGFIGIIFLLGLVTKNAILLVDFIKQRRRQGIDRRQAILESGEIRLRPIMMTTLAMIFGMLPSAMALGTGSELRQPMAFAIIGGLISSTLLTLLVVPVMYTLLDDLKGLFSRKSKAETDAIEAKC